MTSKLDSSSTDNTATHNTYQSSFYENLSFRPREARKRKRAVSPAPHDNDAAAALDFDRASTHAPATNSHQDDTEHNEKRRRGNAPPDGTSADDLLEMFGEMTPEAAKAANVDMALALESIKLKESVAERVARRRRAAAEPFIPKKPGHKNAVTRWRHQHRSPVFGMASLMGPDEQELVLSLRRPKAKFVKFLPFVEDPDTQRVTRAQAKKVVVGKFCACRSPFEDTLVQCKFCMKHFHPACVGKGLHGEDGQHGDRLHAARLSDATYYREKGGFTCPDCDETMFTKKRWTTRKYEAEKRRRGKLFSAKDWLGVDGRPRKCSNCKTKLTVNATSHEDGDMVLRPAK